MQASDLCAPVDYAELRNAFEFVSSASRNVHHAYICKESGVIYWTSTVHELEEPVPDDLKTSKRYIAVPHKTMLKLGQGLALSFIEQTLPDDYNLVASFFRKNGAYRRFKELLQAEGLLEKWFAFEADAADAALLAWCEDHAIDVN